MHVLVTMGYSIFCSYRGTNDQIFKYQCGLENDDCLTYKYPGIESYTIWSLGKRWYLKKYSVSHPEKRQLCKFTPWKYIPWDKKTLENIIIKGPLGFVPPYPCTDKNGIAQYLFKGNFSAKYSQLLTKYSYILAYMQLNLKDNFLW